ncbi:MAG: hypothetical protein H6719_21545 [Sandaracinaceae bacterium]|nr:hypothetical protein [Sandaracinaceae bacterium]
MRWGLPIVVAAGLLAVAPAERAFAQDASASETAAARRLFEEGVAALEEGRFEDARERFERSYGLVPRASTLLNLATAQAELGQIVEAIETYRRFIAEASGRDARHRRDAEAMIDELQPRVASVDLTIPDREPGDVVRLDGRDLPTAALDVALPMSPGSHRLVVRRDGVEIGAVELVLVDGERRSVEVALHPPPPAVEVPIEVAPPPPEDDSGLVIGLGVGIGVAVVAIVVGVALGVALSSGEEPFVGNLGPGMVTF